MFNWQPPRSKFQWTKLLSAVHSNPVSDFIQRKQAHRASILLDDFAHVSHDTIIDLRQTGPISRGAQDKLEMRSLGHAMLLMTDDLTDPTGLQRSPLRFTEAEWQRMERNRGVDGADTVYRRVMKRAADECRDIVVVDDAGEPVMIPHRDAARMHHFAALERDWIQSGPPFDPETEIEIPRSLARDHQLHLREKERARRLGKVPRLMEDKHLPRRHYVLPESVRSIEEIDRAHARAKAIGADGYTELEPMPPLPDGMAAAA